MNDEFLIDCMENEIESSFFDFKKDIYDFDNPKCKEDFLVDVLSFANSHINGNKYIVTGIKMSKDNSRIFNGITESKIKDGSDYQSLINDNIEPNIIVDFKIVEYDGKKYGIFRINDENNDSPYLLSKQYGSLNKGFIKIRKGQKNEFANRKDFDLFYNEKINNAFSDIYIKGIINNKANDKFEVNKFMNEIDKETAKNKIYDLFIEIMNINLVKSSDYLKLGDTLVVDKKDIESIKLYASDNDIELPNDFFDIGNMAYFSMPYSSTNYYGSKSEKQKYKLICELGKITAIFLGLSEFYEEIDKIYYTELLIQNIGKKYDEDIEVTLKIIKDTILKYDNFPKPSEAIIENILDDNYLDSILNNKKINGVNSFTSKIPIVFPTYPSSFKLPIGYTQPDYESYVDYYKKYIQAITNYEITEDDDFCYIKFNQKEIKPNELIHIPSRILFLNIPDVIEYEIKTKLNPSIKKGKLYNNKNS